MLIIKCEEHLVKAKAFAKQIGKLEQLESQLEWLDNYAGREVTECYLYQDFAPHSFEFVIMKNNERWFNGGLIYQGPDQPGDGSFPALTVSLDSSQGWGIHT